jgi:exopolysaccharide biosynthesis predicted pyruvyltransferase EpsI
MVTSLVGQPETVRLLPIEAFAAVFEPLVGRRVGFVAPLGNVGDRLIQRATFQLFREFGIRWKVVDPDQPPDTDELAFGGGGNMGSLYRNNWELRGRILQFGLPVTVLPQSFTSREDRPYKRVYVRERGSLSYCEGASLAPDLALGLSYAARAGAVRGLGVFVRKDPERVVRRPWLSPDPVKICRTTEEYLELAAQYQQIVTDRLHFAICGLIVGRRTTLLPNSYHKNRSMHETWLAGLGCRFAQSVEEAVGRQRAA